MQPKVSYWIIFNPDDKQQIIVRAVMDNGTTRTWRPGDKGFASAKKRAQASLNRKRA